MKSIGAGAMAVPLRPAQRVQKETTPMDDAVSSSTEFTYSAQEARQAEVLLKISIALACARKLRDDGRRLELDSRGGLMVHPPLDSFQQRRMAESGALLEKLLSPQHKQWADYMDGALQFIEQLIADGARPRVTDGRLVADLPEDATCARAMMEFYGAAAIKLLRAHAIARTEEQRHSPWWRKVVAWR
jgi:hypothetical protein